MASAEGQGAQMQTGGQEQIAPRPRPPRSTAARRTSRPAATEAEATAPSTRAIVLGFPAHPPESIAIDGPEKLDAVLLATMAPDKVICPLFAQDYDALVVAQILSRLGFGGTLVVVAPDLPNPRMVEREIRNQAGGIKVAVVVRP